MTLLQRASSVGPPEARVPHNPSARAPYQNAPADRKQPGSASGSPRSGVQLSGCAGSFSRKARGARQGCAVSPLASLAALRAHRAP